ncbi:hypothetical protein JXL83_09190 [candidate division WOR-3 bacterium]|nr:hypothetical protein [candidate division WOR-3 bacterium]
MNKFLILLLSLFLLSDLIANDSDPSWFEKYFPSDSWESKAVIMYFHRNIRCIECLETEEILKVFAEKFNMEESCRVVVFVSLNLDSLENIIFGKTSVISQNTVILSVKNSSGNLMLKTFQDVVLYRDSSNHFLDTLGSKLKEMLN